MNARIVGVDLALSTAHKAVILDGEETIGSLTVPMDREGFDRLIERATRGAEGPCEFVLEPTGNVWLVVGALLAHRGFLVRLVKGQKVASVRQFYSKHCKTDLTDAAAMARVPMLDPQNGAFPLQLPGIEVLNLKRLVRQRDRLVKETTRRKLFIESMWVIANPLLGQALGRDKFTTAKKAFLRRFLDPAKVKRLGKSRLAVFFTTRSRGSIRVEAVEAIYEACVKTADLYEPLRTSGQLPLDYEQLQEELNLELDFLDGFEAGTAKLEKRIEELYQAIDPDRTLTKLPGVGDRLAPLIEAHVGDVSRFRNIRAFASFCGVAPRRRQTGKSLGAKGLPITKAGQVLLRKALYLAARLAIRSDPEFAAAYTRLKARGLHENKALMVLAHKQARRIYAILNRRANGIGAGDVPYQFRTPGGRPLDQTQARTYVREHFPSKRQRLENARRDSAREGIAPGEVEDTGRRPVVSGQPEGSTIRDAPPDPVPANVLVQRVMDRLEAKARKGRVGGVSVENQVGKC